MDAMEAPTIYTMPTSSAQWDKVGIFYICFCVIWTTLVFAGMTFCWFNRRVPILKIRGLLLSFAAIIFLHAYWCLAQITYPIGRTIPTVLAYDIQYFFMGIWFPLGIALFHASNLRFLHIAKRQRQFAHAEQFAPKHGAKRCNGAHSSWLCRLRNMQYTKRAMIFIGVGMIAQVLLTVGMWFACRKYHPTFGIPGTEIQGVSFPEQLEDLGRGWEWWPSVLWQLIWTWVVAPILIWKAWGIRDTMGWRTQTIGCCLANLHATPMFLIASYVPAFRPVNMYFTPSQWIHLSIMIFEIFTVFLPCFQVLRLRIMAKKAAESNAEWDVTSETTTLQGLTSIRSRSSPASITEKDASLQYLEEAVGDDRLYTMAALDRVLAQNPEPLLEFSALSDFSGENIAFLTRLDAWKSVQSSSQGDEERLQAFHGALAIYVDFISPRDAEFPLNVASKDLKSLEALFERPTRMLRGEPAPDPAAPFESSQPPAWNGPSIALHPPMDTTTGVAILYTGEIPAGFDISVFDSVQSHIKYLVLTNTWPKFITEMQQRRRRSNESERSAASKGSQETLASSVSSQVTKFIRSLA